MNLDEMSTKNSAIETNDNAIEITNGSFKWNTKDEKPYLKDINIKLKGICQIVSSKIQIQWCAIENHQDTFYVVFQDVLTDVKSGILLFFKLCTDTYGLGLSNEPLFVIVTQVAAKL